MAFQGPITSSNIAFGIVGELFDNSPHRGQPGWLDSANAANNVIGRAFTVKAGASGNHATPTDPAPLKVQAGGTGAFAGILANPKVYASYGDPTGGPLAPSMVIPNARIGELITMGHIIVEAGAACTVGMVAEYVNATGALIMVLASSTTPATRTRIEGSQVVRYDGGPTGVCVLELGGTVSLTPGA